MWESGVAEVLVVDDDVFLRLDLSDRLRQRGFVVFRAGDAAQAITTMEKHPSIAAVFSDLQIPGSMDGLMLLREIARRWPRRYLVLISGWSFPSQGELPPGTQFLSKPITRTSLDRILHLFLDSEPSPSG